MNTTFRLGTTTVEHGHLSSHQQFTLDADSLTTHALILGQTGSGKTGMGISLLEEAAIAGVPCIAVDPKGDLGNLLLQFPQLRPEDFAPWCDNPEASAKQWRKGLGSDASRIRDLLSTTELRVYTPGSTQGHPLALLKDLRPPGVEGDDLWRLIQAETVGLLELAGVSCDAISGPEAMLLSHLIERHWVRGNTLALEDLPRLVTTPPFKKIGSLSLENACPKSKRKQLARKLNALISSPAMRSWGAGPDLDIGSLLRSSTGKPRISVLSIAHLGDEQRMFFLTKLLSEVVAWMRKQRGTRHLRSLLYIDEVFGYLPPVKNPPTKGPLLLLLKQARAFGLGVVLASQNPIDVDYRALSNLGTWILGRLQTERDVARVADGLRAAAAEQGEDLDVSELKSMLAGLPKRTFLVRSPDTPGCQLVKSRHTLSFLRGPLTLEEIRRLTAEPVAGEPWGPPPELDEVFSEEQVEDEQEEERIAGMTDAEFDALLQEGCGALHNGAMGLARALKTAEFAETATTDFRRLNATMTRSRQLINEGKYDEAMAAWDEHDAAFAASKAKVAPHPDPAPEPAGGEQETIHEILVPEESSLEEEIEKIVAAKVGPRWPWILAGAVLGWAVPIALLLILY
ncbi:MAG: ATP-binding protein [Planctomycetota bacterium]|jgi:hypothetical protein